MMPTMIATWAEHDARCAIHDVDRSAIAATEALRSLVLELFTGPDPRDLWSACARLGALMATAGASPSLAATTIDGAVCALSDGGVVVEPSRIPPGRASLLEGYVGTIHDAERAAAAALWEYPACAVPLSDDRGTVAIACGHPTSDREALAGWASRVAGQLVKAKTRRILLAGPERARTELTVAAELVGIEVLADLPRPEPTRGSWLRLPWRR